MRVLITGGAGFIGSHLAERLLARGDEVVVVDNYETGRRDNLSEHERLAVVEGTIADEAVVDQAFGAGGSPDLVIHAAAAYKDPEAWAEDARTNVLGTANVVRAAEQAGVERLIYFQTALCYGLQPLEQPITLSHPLRPEGSSYAISKTAGEQYVQLSGLDWISFRLANAYGPRNLSGPLPTFYQRLTSGRGVFVMDTRRDFIFVDDLVDCVMRAVDGSGRPRPVPRLLRLRLLDQGAVRRHHRGARARRPGRRRGAAPESRRRADDPARPVRDGARLRLADHDAAQGRASRGRSRTTASTASRRRTRT